VSEGGRRPPLLAATRPSTLTWFGPDLRILKRAFQVPLTFVVACAASGCGDTPMQSVDPGPPQIGCPSAPPPVQSSDGRGAIVSYGNASVVGGTPPLVGPTCTPASGGTFPIGSSTVTCTVTDAKQRSDACALTLTVAKAPGLATTNFLAFGDSMTAGEIVSEGLTAGVHVLLVDPALSYPTDLQRDLDLRYPTSHAFVMNSGTSGDHTSDGVTKLPTAISGFHQVQAVLLMDGANDLFGGDPTAVTPAVNNMDRMVRYVKSIPGLRVMVATLPPQNPAACPNGVGCVFRARGAGLVVTYNNGLKAMAASEGISIVDVYQAFNGDVTTLIDSDGLHPTAAGYQVIADTFFGIIRQAFETTSIITEPFSRPLSRPFSLPFKGPAPPPRRR
jgi:lysophospholipase L1-like esterase